MTPTPTVMPTAPESRDAVARTSPDRPSTDPAAPSRRTLWTHVALLLALAAALWAFRLRGPLNLQYDAASYYVTGTALAEGKGYRLLSEPGQVRAVQYPPALPAVVAVVQLLCGSSDPAVAGWWLRVLYAGVFVAYVLATYALALRFVPAWAALAVGVVAALHHHTLYLSDVLFTEVPFALLATLMILASRRADRPAGFAATAVLGAIAFLMRTAGVALLAAWCGEALFRRQWRQLALRCVVTAVPVFAWQAYTVSVTRGEDYRNPAYEYQRADYQYYNVPYAQNLRLRDPFKPELGLVTAGEMARRTLGTTGQMLAGGLGQAVTMDLTAWRWVVGRVTDRAGLPQIPRDVLWAGLAVLRLLPVLGLVLLAVRGQWIIPMYVAASVVIIGVTPWPAQFSRYLTPVAGVVAIAMVYATIAAARPLAARTGRAWVVPAAVVVVVLAVLAMAVPFAGRALKPPLMATLRGGPHDDANRLLYYHPGWVAYDKALAWLKREAPADAVIATATPQYAYISTGRTSVMFPMEIDRATERRLLAGAGVTHAVVDTADVGEIISNYAAPALKDSPDWQVVYTDADGKTVIYQRRVGN